MKDKINDIDGMTMSFAVRAKAVGRMGFRVDLKAGRFVGMEGAAEHPVLIRLQAVVL